MFSSAWGGDGAIAITAFFCFNSSTAESASSRRDGGATEGAISLSASTVAEAPASLSRLLVAGWLAGARSWAVYGTGESSGRFNSATITGCAWWLTDAMRVPCQTATMAIAATPAVANPATTG